MFTEQQIKAAHSKVKSGADFPRYIQEIKKLGLIRYEYFLKNGVTIYYGQNDYKVQSAPTREPIDITSNSSATTLKNTITIHQQGKTDFPTFCQQAADAGVEKWIVDTERMLCTYYDLQGKELISEPIPQATYD